MIVSLRKEGQDPGVHAEAATAADEPSPQEMAGAIRRLLANQTQLNNQLSATMAALGTLTTAVARQNTTIATLMDEVKRLRADQPRRPLSTH